MIRRAQHLEHRGYKIYDVAAICPAGRLDVSCAKRLLRAIRRLADAGLRACVFDLTHVEALDSSGFGSLVAAIRKMEEVGGAAAVVCGNPTIRRLFEISGMARLAPVVGGLEEAQAILSTTCSALAS